MSPRQLAFAGGVAAVVFAACAVLLSGGEPEESSPGLTGGPSPGAGLEQPSGETPGPRATPRDRGGSPAIPRPDQPGAARPEPAVSLLTGRVVDGQGRFLAAARLEAILGPEGPLEPPPAWGCDAQGAFAQPPPTGPGRYALRVACPGFGGRVVPVETGRPLRVVLGPEASLGGLCHDAERRGVAATLTLNSGDWSGRVRSDAAGRFELAGIPPGIVSVRVDPDPQAGTCGLTVETLLRPGERGQLDLLLPTGQELLGQVLDARGRPVPGTRLRLRAGSDLSGATRERAADDEGRFRFAGVAPGEASLIALHRTEGSIGPLMVAIPDGHDPDPLAVELAPLSELRGTLRDLGGQPVAGAACRLDPDPLGLGWPGAHGARSGRDGRFRIAKVPAGEYVLRVSGPGFVELEQPLLVDPRGTAPWDLTLLPAGALRGLVRLADGSPAAGAQVEVQSERLRQVRCDGAGAFALNGLASGATFVRASAPGAGSAAQELHLREGETAELSLELGPPRSLAGSVQSEEGQALPGATVSLRGFADERTVLADETGRFALADLGEGPYFVEARALGYLPGAQESVRPGASLRFVLVPERPVLGTVTGPDGEPVWEFLVVPLGDPEGALVFEEGRFALPLAPGISELEVRAMGLAPARVAVPPGGGELSVSLRGGVEAHGHVLAPDRSPLSGAAILFGRQREENLMGPNTRFEVLGMSEGADAHFHIPGVPPEGIEVTVSHPEHGTLWTRLLPGESHLELPPGGSIAGRVLDPQGRPVADAPLRIEGPVIRFAASDPDGRYRIGGLLPGPYTLIRADTEQQTQVDVAAGQVRRVDLR